MMRFQRFIALVILLIPGAIGVYGVKLMRDALFTAFDPELGFQWTIMVLGIVFFIFGIAFVGGFIFYRDKKRRLLQPRFLDDLDD